MTEQYADKMQVILNRRYCRKKGVRRIRVYTNAECIHVYVPRRKVMTVVKPMMINELTKYFGLRGWIVVWWLKAERNWEPWQFHDEL
jgi:hypothetical protein